MIVRRNIKKGGVRRSDYGRVKLRSSTLKTIILANGHFNKPVTLEKFRGNNYYIN